MFLWLPVFDAKLFKDNSVVIIVSPLISLVVDQVQSLHRRSVRAAILSSGSNVDKEFVAKDDDIHHGCLFFVHLK